MGFFRKKQKMDLLRHQEDVLSPIYDPHKTVVINPVDIAGGEPTIRYSSS